MARTLSPWQLVHTYLHYEGQPAAWHLLLWLLIRLHVSYSGLHWFCALAALAGVAVLVFCAPFPRWMKLSIPFTFFFSYQYAVLARNYCLVPLLLFGVAFFWKKSPIAVALLLGLLGNISNHGAAIAAGFGIAYWLERRGRSRRGEPVPAKAQFRTAALLLLASGAVALLTAYPARDVAYPYAMAVHGYFGPKLFGAGGILLWGMWQPIWLGLAGWTLVLWGISRRNALYLAAPIVTMVLFSTIVGLMFWHSGLMVIVVLTILWVTWPQDGGRSTTPELCLRAAIAVLIATQIGWTMFAARYDRFHDVSPGPAAAGFLSPYISAGASVVTFSRRNAYNTVAIAPYFPRKVFANWPAPFWLWSRANKADSDFWSALNAHPDIVLVENYHYLDTPRQANDLSDDPAMRSTIAAIEERGYRLDRSFCGGTPERFDIRNGLCYFILLKSR